MILPIVLWLTMCFNAQFLGLNLVSRDAACDWDRVAVFN
jgi:hypothetical protein